jgi:hypothetical protein
MDIAILDQSRRKAYTSQRMKSTDRYEVSATSKPASSILRESFDGGDAPAVAKRLVSNAMP